jgi:hypothetical protein
MAMDGVREGSSCNARTTDLEYGIAAIHRGNLDHPLSRVKSRDRYHHLSRI